MTELSEFLLKRRSVVVRNMEEPGPSSEDLEKIMRAGMRVPDHGRLTPWRFIVIRGEAREKLGKILGDAFRKENPDCIDEQVKIEEERFVRAPSTIAIVSRTNPEHKIPEWEQILSSGAACQNMLTAALGMGFAAQWITEWYAYNDDVKTALGLESGDRIAGFLYLGSMTDAPSDRQRPEYEDIVSEWTEPAA
ncbi:MAG: nitroreductase [Rhodospirillaceae bacterium]|nr:nitroreductase [Rhodospirillaceae bacterium]|tara:strand:+ start:7864 stop:8442 length:579 start_codon:yes stop_codon:yes gene_type:complete